MPKFFHEIEPPTIEDIVRHWLFSVLHVCRATVGLMHPGASIVNVTSDAAKVPIVEETVIGAALPGIAMLTRSFAMEAERHGVRVNAVTPSVVVGTGTYDRINSDSFSRKRFAKAGGVAHLGVPGLNDVAGAIIFLASGASPCITGQLLSINGGISA